MWDREVDYGVIYLFTFWGLILAGFITLLFIIKKLGVKRFCRGIRFVVTFHWVFKLINFLRIKFFKGPEAVIHDGITEIMENDEEFV